MSQVTLSMQEQRTLQVLTLLSEGHMTAREAAEQLGHSVRHVRRELKAFREQGATSIPHGNRGRKPPNAICAQLRQRVAGLAQETYQAYNNHHLKDQLAETHGIAISVSSVRRIRAQANVPSPRKRRPPKHRTKRERKPQAGMMLQLDGSNHRWFGPQHPPCELLGAVDDATGTVCAALFRHEEDTVGYMLLLGQVMRRHGVPLSLYSDRHSTFFVNHSEKPTVEEQLQGQEPTTQFGRAAGQLGIRLIRAYSPQAKGRVEKLFGTFQDRLIAEMATHQITSIDQANAFLPGFLERYNRRFAKAAADPQTAFRPAPPRQQLGCILCLQFPRTVANDHTISFGNRRLPVAHGSKVSYARKQIVVHVSLDGQLSYWLADHCLGKGPTATGPLTTDPCAIARQLPPPPPPPPISQPPTQPRQRKHQQRPTVIPSPNHPWRKFRYGKPHPDTL